MSEKIVLKWDGNIFINVYVNCGWQQKVTITPKGKEAEVLIGKGEALMLSQLEYENVKNFDIKIEHLPENDASQEYLESKTKVHYLTDKPGFNNILIVSDDSFGDDDYNDVMISISFIKTK